MAYAKSCGIYKVSVVEQGKDAGNISQQPDDAAIKQELIVGPAYRKALVKTSYLVSF